MCYYTSMKVTTGRQTIRAAKFHTEGPDSITVYHVLEPRLYSEIITWADDYKSGSNRTANLENWVKDYLYSSLKDKEWKINTEDEVEDLERVSNSLIFLRPEYVVEEHFVIEVAEHPSGDLIWTPILKGKTFEELWR